MPLSTLLASRNISTEKAAIDNTCIFLTNLQAICSIQNTLVTKSL